MSVRSHHSHRLRLQLPQDAIEDRPALLGADCERCVGDELLQIARTDAPALVEPNRRKAREFVTRKAQDFEVRTSTVECHSLLTSCSNLNGRWREFPCDFSELLRRNRNRTHRLDIRGYFSADGNIEIRSGQTDSLIRRLHE